MNIPVLKVDIPDVSDKPRRIVRAVRKALKAAHRRSLNEAVEIIKRAIHETNSSATGRMLNSVTYKLLNDRVDTGNFESVVYFRNVPYAYYADEGRDEGGKPPASAIRKWMRARGISEEFFGRILGSIRADGTEGKHFMRLANPRIKRSNDKIVREALSNLNVENS